MQHSSPPGSLAARVAGMKERTSPLSAHRRIEYLQRQVLELEDALNDADIEMSELTQSVRQANERARSAERAYAELEADYDSVVLALREAEETITVLQEEMNEGAHHSRSSGHSHSHNHSHSHGHNHDHSHGHSHGHSGRHRHNDYSSDGSPLASSSDVREQLAELEHRLAEESRLRARAEAGLKKVMDTIREASKENQALLTAQQGLEKQLFSERGRREQAEAEIDELEAALNEKSDELAAKTKEVEAKNSTISALNSELESWKRGPAGPSTPMTPRGQSMQFQLLEGQLSQARAALNSERNSRAKVEEKVAALEKEVREQSARYKASLKMYQLRLAMVSGKEVTNSPDDNMPDERSSETRVADAKKTLHYAVMGATMDDPTIPE